MVESHHVGCWELNSGPSEERSVLLTAVPSLQPYTLAFRPVMFGFTLGPGLASLWILVTQAVEWTLSQTRHCLTTPTSSVPLLS